MKKHATGLRGVCLINDNIGASKCKLVQDFLETETVVQLPNPPYSPVLSPCDFFPFALQKKQSLQTSI